jgi:hypothetical protein
MLSVNFTFHLHQPLGNFDFVIDRACEDAYFPLLDALAAHPSFRCTLHISGCLFDHLSVRHPEFLQRVQELARRGQVEMLASGYYEPILVEIPRRDALEQVRLMREFIRANINQEPEGLWCTERIYDLNLPEIAKEAGLEFTLLDDYLFLRVLEEEDLYRHYVLTEQGNELLIFPISEKLRYLIPFKPVAELAAHLDTLDRTYAERGIEDPIAVFGDDGEKFGVWPGTKEWVYGSGWLKEFLAFFEEHAERFPLVHLGEFARAHPPAGLVTLPAGSYREMCEWVLPVDRQRRLAQAKRMLTTKGIPRPEQVLFSGNFKFFYRKYDEANRMHHKTRNLSNLTWMGIDRAQGEEDKKLAQEALRHHLRSQCNCGYWHGIFGGIYLNYLREAVNEQMIKAERTAHAALHTKLPHVVRLDFYSNSLDEILVFDEGYSMLLLPQRGLSLDYCDYPPADATLLAGMGRHYEYYHDELLSGRGRDAREAHKSIHESVRMKDGSALASAAFDAYPRLSFVDMAFAQEVRTADFAQGGMQPQHELWRESYETELSPHGVSGRADAPLGRIDKIVGWDGPVLTVRWEIQPKPDAGAEWFATELNINLLTDRSDDRFALYKADRLPLAELWETDAPEAELVFVDGYRRTRIALTSEGFARIGFYPVRTLAMSEGGAELLYQAQAVVLIARLPTTESSQFSVTIDVSPL